MESDTVTRGRAVRLLAVLGVLALLGGCGTQQAAISSADEATTTSLLQALYSDTIGTAADREAVAVLQFDALHRPITECMARAGFDSPVPRYVDEYPGVKTLYPDFIDAVVPVDSSFVDQEGLGRSAAVSRAMADGQTGETTIPTNPAYKQLAGSKQAAFTDQLARCTPGPSAYAGFGEPQASRTLSGELVALVKTSLARDDRAVSLARGYADCMSKAGFKVRSRDDLIQAIDAEYAAIQGTRSFQEATGSDAWRAEQDRERAAASADASCRSDLHNQAMAVLATPLKTFRNQHADQIAALADQWAQVRSNAAAARATWPKLG